MEARYKEKDLPNYKEIGNWKVEIKDTKAEIKIYRGITDIKGRGGFFEATKEGKGDPFYFVDASFSRETFFMAASLLQAVSLHYGCPRVIGYVFDYLKMRESELEEILTNTQSESEYNWKTQRNVLKCIFALEEQSKTQSLK